MTGTTSFLRQKILQKGYSTLIDFSRACGVCDQTIEKWEHGTIPKSDTMVYRVAGLLDVAPTDIWPDWVPGVRKNKPHIDVGTKATKDPVPDDFVPPSVYVGRKFYKRAEGHIIPATVVDCKKHWFMVRFDARFGSYFECFTYQSLRDCELKQYKAE